MKRSNILLLTYDFPPLSGGISVLMDKIANCLKERGICVLTAEVSREFKKFDSEADFPIIRKSFTVHVPNWRLPFILIKVFIYILKIYATYRFEVIFIGEVFPLGFIGLIFKLFFRVPFVTFSHGSDSLLVPNKFRNFLVGCIYRRANYVICFSDYTRSNLLKWSIKNEIIKKVSIGIDTELFHPAVDISQVVKQFNLKDKKVILTVNRLTPRKGIDSVINCLPELVKNVPSIIYLIVGEGKDENRLKDLVRSLNLGDYVIFTGEIKHNSLPEFYNSCDIFVNAVREIRETERLETEGFGLVNIEASACSKPVIAGATGGVVDAIENGKTGLLINPTNLQELKSAILLLLNDNANAKKMGEAGRQKVLRQFSMENMKSDINKILEGAI